MKHFLSSIFSVDTLKIRWKTPRCVLFAVIVICLTEILVARTDFIWKQEPRSMLAEMLEMEQSIIQKHPHPKILIFGSSRAQAAFLPTLMEKQMNLQRGEVLNLGMSGFFLYSALKVYMRNRSILAGADIVIIEMEYHHLDIKTIEPDERCRYLINWSDWLAYKGPKRWSLLRSLLFKLPDAVPYVRAYLKHWFSEGHSPEPVGIDKYGRQAFWEISDFHDERRWRDPNYFKEQAISFHNNYEYSKTALEYFQELVRLAKEDGASVYIIQIPYPEIWTMNLRQYLGNEYNQYKRNVCHAVAGLVEKVQFWENASEAGLSDHDYREQDHLNTVGAIKWTTFFVQWLKQIRSK